uniref:NADH dehydrogenase [ubiquinone] 1 beta subcomplex subunit 2, mitochondrial n=1 Tax=Panagrolaimus davidi TaxID=227884 RepID=A0A914QJD3_9BILA
MLMRKIANPIAIQRQLRLFVQRNPGVVFNGIRHKWVSGAQAKNTNNIPVGTRLGHEEDPELHTYDGEYRGTPSKGDTLIPDYLYRSVPPGSTYIDRCVSTVLGTCMWFWFLYHMYYHSGHILGHWYMPYTSEFTDEELGIPSDNAEDPEYWGNHDKPYGTYR